MNGYASYDYKELIVDAREVSRFLDGYENFGWRPDEHQQEVRTIGNVRLRLKRNRRITNKAELTRLQRHFEDCISQIRNLEQSKTSQATMVGLIVGIAGTAFMAGATFAVTHQPPLIWLTILLAIPGFIGWAMAPLMFKKMAARRSEDVNQLIEEKFDEMDEICEKGHRLLQYEHEPGTSEA